MPNVDFIPQQNVDLNPFFDSRRLTRMVEQMPLPTAALLRLAFQKVELFDSKFVEVSIYDGDRIIAPHVSRSAKGQVIEKKSVSKAVVEPPYMKPKKIIEMDDIRQAIRGGNPYTQTPGQSLTELVARETMELDNAITRSEERMALQSVLKRKVEAIDEEGNPVGTEIFFPVEPGFDMAVNLSTYVGGFIEAIVEGRRRIAKKTKGLAAKIVLHGSVSAVKFRNSPSVRLASNRDYSDRGRYVELLEAMGLIFLGRFDSVEHYEYADWYINPATGNEEPVIPDDKYILLADNSAATRYYAAIESFSQLVPARRFIKSAPPKDGDDPEVWTIQEHSAPLPAPVQPYAFLVGTVSNAEPTD